MFFKNNKGASGPSYGIILGLIALVSLGALSLTGEQVSSLFGSAGDRANQVINPDGTPEVSNFSITGLLEGDPAAVRDISTMASDPRGEALSFSLRNAPSYVSLSGTTLTIDTTDPSLDYLIAGQAETLSVGVSVTNKSGKQASGALSVEITGTNDAPIAGDDLLSASASGPIGIDGNDSDPDLSDLLTVTINGAPAGLSVKGTDIELDISAYASLDDGESQEVNFTYNLADAELSDQAFVTLTVHGENDAPVFDLIPQQESGNKQITEIDLSNYLSDPDTNDQATLALTATLSGLKEDGVTDISSYLAPNGKSITFDPTVIYSDLQPEQQDLATVTVQAFDGTDYTSTSFDLLVTGANALAGLEEAFVTWNRHDQGSLILQNNDLTVYGGGSAANATVTLNVKIPNTSKWEIQSKINTYDNGYPMIGFAPLNKKRNTTIRASDAYAIKKYINSYKVNSGTGEWYTPVNAPTSDLTNVIKFNYDADTKNLWIGITRDGATTWLTNESGQSGSPSSETNPTISNVPNDYFVAATVYRNDKLTVATNRTNMWEPIEPGYQSLDLINLPQPSTYKTEDHFETLTWRGNSSSQDIVSQNWGEDDQFIWIKSRTSTHWHEMYDTLRRPGFALSSNSYTAESSFWGVKSINNDGFTVEATPYSHGTNNEGNGYVGWRFKAGKAQLNNKGSIVSQVSHNPDLGFSIVRYTGDYNQGATIGHGGSKPPFFVMVKSLNNNYGWMTYHQELGPLKAAPLNDSNVVEDIRLWNNTSPNENVIELGSSENVNKGGDEYIAYVFFESDLVKPVRFTGNGSGNGPFLYANGKPSFVIMRRYDAPGSWGILDLARLNSDNVNTQIYANLTNLEDAGNSIEFTAVGLKQKSSTAWSNISGAKYMGLIILDKAIQESLSGQDF